MQQAVFQIGAGYLNIFSQLEAAFKTPAGDTEMKIVCPFALGQGTPFHDQGVFLHRDLDICLAEACHRHGNAVVVFKLFDLL